MPYQGEAPYIPQVDEALQQAVTAPWPNQAQKLLSTHDALQTQTFLAPRKDYELGNRLLPVAAYREQLVDTIMAHQVTIVDSGTGTGKSTQVSQYLLETGERRKIVLLQPRIIAAREVGQRQASELTAAGNDGSKLVGYHTANEYNTTPDNEIVVCTDGLALMQMLANSAITRDDTVLIDEFHERGVNMDVALALCHEKGIHTVIMSATMDSNSIARRASEARGGAPTPVVRVPGKTYPVEERTEGLLHEAVIRLAKELTKERRDSGILVFVPGRRETWQTYGKLQKRLPNGMTLLALNGDQTIEEQQKSLQHYPEGKVVLSTAIGQTSLTIPDIHAVVDCGWERTGSFSRGVNALPIQISSDATADQRRGRVGRVMPGIYVRAQLEGYPPIPKTKKGELIRHSYDDPKIMHVDLASFVARLGLSNLDILDLPLPDRPLLSEVEDAEKRLRDIGAIKIDSLALSSLGKEIAHLPLDMQFARMVVESRKYPDEIQAKVMAMVSAAQQKNIYSTEADKMSWQQLTHENRSDMVVQAEIFLKTLSMTEERRNQYNIVEIRWQKAVRQLERLMQDAGLDTSLLETPLTEADRQAMFDCILSAGCEVFVRLGRSNKFRDRRGHSRELASSSLLEDSHHIVVGIPFNIAHMRSFGLRVQPIITQASGVDLEQLRKYLPDKISYRPLAFVLGSDGVVQQEYAVHYETQPLRQTVVEPAAPSEEAKQYLIRRFLSRSRFVNEDAELKKLYSALQDVEALQHRTDIDLKISDLYAVMAAELTQQPAEDLRSLNNIPEYLNPVMIRTHIPRNLREQILAASPDVLRIETSQAINESQIEYIDNIAYLTLLPQVIAELPDTIPELGERKIRVRTSRNHQYEDLDEARARYQREARSRRRGQTGPENFGNGPIDDYNTTDDAVSQPTIVVTTSSRRRSFHRRS